MTDMAGTVHTPLGTVKKKQLLIVGGGAALLVGVYVYRKRQAAASASSSQTAGSAASPSAATDPATGYPTGSPEDTAALQASSLAAYGGYNGAVGGGGGGDTLSTPPTSTPGFSSNAAWAQAAESYLAQTAGSDPTAVSAALGKYLTGQQVTDAQAQIIQSAIAFEGYPPVSGADSYPPSIRQAPVPTPTPTPTPAPDVAPKAPTRLQQIGAVYTTSIEVAWDVSPGADHYELHMDGRAISTHQETWAKVGGLKPGSRHTFQVYALSHSGKKSPGSATLTLSTKK